MSTEPAAIDTQATSRTFRYVRGRLSDRRKRIPTFEFKASSTNYTGGGYARVRTEEDRPDKPGDGLSTAYVSIHRLAAVVWCYDADRPLDEIQEDMIGKDVHHVLGMPSANGEEFVEVVDHGGHSGITNTQKRAWAEDAKRARDGEWEPDDDGTCDECHDRDAEATFDAVDEVYCIECASERARATDETIQIL